MSPNLVNGFVHGHDVFGRADRLEVVAGAADPAGVAINGHALAHLADDVVHRAERQRLLVVDRAVEDDSPAEIGHEPFPLHARTAPLNRIENFDADPIDQVGQKHPRRAVGVIHHVDAERAGQLGHLDLVRQQEAAIHGQAHQRAGLRAQVLGDEVKSIRPRPAAKMRR